MDYQRIYEYRFKDTNFNDKLKVWKEISSFLYKFMGKPKSILDPAAWMCEFINSFQLKKNGPSISKTAVKSFQMKGTRLLLGIFSISLWPKVTLTLYLCLTS